MLGVQIANTLPARVLARVQHSKDLGAHSGALVLLLQCLNLNQAKPSSEYRLKANEQIREKYSCSINAAIGIGWYSSFSSIP